MKRTLSLLLSAGFCVVCLSAASTTTFTTNTLISAVTTDYDGQDLVVSGCILTVNGSHLFNSLLLTNGALLTHSPAPAGEAGSCIDLTIAQDVWVDGSCRIDAGGLGYAPAAGPGAGGSSVLIAGSGGGHGGGGGTGSANATAGATYDDPLSPRQFGSGGGNGYSCLGGAGGGIVKLSVGGTLWLNGATLAAEGASGSGGAWGGAGGGGTVVLSVSRLAGFGIISANGGAAASKGTGGGGGGGRVVILCQTNVFRGSVSASGGAGFQFGGAGSVYTRVAGDPLGSLVFDNGGNSGQASSLTPLSLCHLVIANQAIVIAPPLLTNASLLVRSNGLLACAPGQAIGLTILSNLTIEAGGRLDVSGQGWGAGLGPGGGIHSTKGGGGAGHGGEGGSTAAAGGGSSYGSLVTPSELGAGGGDGYYSAGGAGGGCLQVSVGGVLWVDGALRADGQNGLGYGYVWAGGGAGGSVWVTANGIAGSGTISVNGGNGGSGGGGGAGGRIALYFITNLFSGTLSAYGGAGAQPGGAGTIFTQAAAAPRGMALIHNGGNLGGITRLDTAFWPLAQTFDLTVAGAAAIVPNMPLTFGNIVITSSGMVTHSPGQNTLQLVAQTDFLMDGSAAVRADGLGYGPGQGPGAGIGSDSGGGGGGSYGGVGGAGRAGGGGGLTYGSSLQPLDFGSGAGAGLFSVGGAGGGFIRLSAGRIMQINGTISANGLGSVNGSESQLYCGGGSGGSVFLTAAILSVTGTITANGGPAYQGGGGGGGRIAINGSVEVDLSTPPMAAGGLGGDGSDPARNGMAGSVVISTNLPPFQVVSLSPAGLVNHPFGSVDVAFNAGIAVDTLTPAQVSLTTPAGPLDSRQITVQALGGALVRISWPMQTLLGQYVITVGPGIKDLYGRQMDQNGNGITGEIADVFAASLTLGSAVAVSGTIRLANGQAATGILLRTSDGQTVTTDARGVYALDLVQGWTGSITPMRLGCSFSPASLSYTNLAGSLAVQDYALSLAFLPSLHVSSLGSGFRVVWASLAGIQYQLQTSPDLRAWTDLGAPLAGTGGTLYWVFDSSLAPRLYVRVKASN